ncbi:tripartite tricarboxylate transporter substrate binding protein [Falsiroseomonas sp.]|uniref:Bug family tripartite tricarboxylate transporter substrate binding protein n=1 Tax=Falsiroseomonas sp. TaxID=2870721 RepID=UPI0027355055|nr:tripartite tricarboxylate transporter substrate binding protein [Falsiroseomonas sp.]MDP3418539.1 tripartite tricarboxylate transporter substrate binding protein [Falsiroseomonas sp.]
MRVLANQIRRNPRLTRSLPRDTLKSKKARGNAMYRRNLLCSTLGGAAILAAPGVRAQARWPDRPVRLVIPFAPGSSSDTVARLVMSKASEMLGQQVVIENRAGAGGLIAVQSVLRAPNDGYTYLWGGGTAITAAVMQPNPGFDWATAFAPVIVVAEQPAVLCVKTAAPWADISALLAAAKASEHGLRYGSGGVGTPAHMAAAAMLRLIEAKGVHVPYRGANQAALAVEQGEVDFAFAISNIAVPRAQAGLVRILLTGGARRMSMMPEVPTLAETLSGGPVVTSVASIVGAAGIPAEAISRLHAVVHRVVSNDAALQDMLTRDGGEVSLSDNPGQYAAQWPEEHARLTRLIELSGAKVE